MSTATRLVYRPTAGDVFRRALQQYLLVPRLRLERLLGGPLVALVGAALLALGLPGLETTLVTAGAALLAFGLVLTAWPLAMIALAMAARWRAVLDPEPITLQLDAGWITLDSQEGQLRYPLAEIDRLEPRGRDVWVRLKDGQVVMVPTGGVTEGDPQRFLDALKQWRPPT